MTCTNRGAAVLVAALLLAGSGLRAQQTVVQPQRNVQATTVTVQSAAAADGNGSTLDVRGYGAVLVRVSGTLGGGTTVVFEVLPAGQSVWKDTLGFAVGGSSLSTTTTTTGDFWVNVGGYASFRARIASYSTGSVTVTATPVLAPVPLPTVMVGSSALPAGAATAEKQDTGNTSVASIDGKVATAANQTTANSALASIDTKVTGVATGSKQDTGNASLASIDTKLDTISSRLDTIDNVVSGTGANVSAYGGTTVAADKCRTATTPAKLLSTTATTTTQIAGVAGKKIWVCGGFINVFGTVNFNILAGSTTTTPCDTGTSSLISNGTTAAQGVAGVAGWGLFMLNQGFTQWETPNTGDSVCIVASGAVVIAGELRIVQDVP